ncbi:alpha/beta fold hydrolase [Streptomyces sp. NPDC086077]|uniref:thioesterase II family protein n=1 Tax=Streptomyces sp. NPDC086077 TaxID=3154862 RepID=UPI00341E1D82
MTGQSAKPTSATAQGVDLECMVPLTPDAKGLPRLICVPYAGGGASVYRPWAKLAEGRLEVWAVRPPGRESRFREPAHEHVEPFVDALVGTVRPLIDDGAPFALFGHSMGAVVSFELAHALRRCGLPEPGHLFVGGRRAPRFPDSTPIHRLDSATFLDAVLRLEGIPQEILSEPGLIDLVLPTLRADFAVAETYRYTPVEPLDCPITAFGGLSDPTTSSEQLAAWRDFTGGAFRQRMLPGDHFFVHSAVREVVESVIEDFESSRDGRTVNRMRQE